MTQNTGTLSENVVVEDNMKRSALFQKRSTTSIGKVADMQSGDKQGSSEIDHTEEEMTVDTPSSHGSVLDFVTAQTVFVKASKASTNGHFQSTLERTFTEQMSSLQRNDRSCVEMLRQHWESDNPPIPTIVFLRFARFYDFNVRKARKGLRNFDKRLLSLTAAKMGPILQSKVSIAACDNLKRAFTSH